MKIVHNRLLGGWFIVRGAHQTPIGGRFDSKEQAQAHLNRRHLPAKMQPTPEILAARREQAQRNARWMPAEPDETHPAPVRGIRMSGSPFARGY